METKDLSTLKPNPSNPRVMNKADVEALANSIREFGDLSSVVFNIRTQQLVGGHARTRIFGEKLPGDKQIIITERYAQPNHVGTVAIGYVIYNNEKYGYREVDWPLERETAANIAANKLTGTFDDQLLAEANYMLSQQAPDLLALTGQSPDELLKSLNSVSSSSEPQSDDTNQEPAEDEKWTFQLTPMQSDIVHAVIDRVKKENGLDYKDHGTALYYLCQEWLNTHKAEQVEPAIPTDRLDSTPADYIAS